MFVSLPTARMPDRQARARRLRESGISIRAIAAQLGVSPSSVHKWTCDIQLTPEQQAAIRTSVAVQRARAAGTAAMRTQALRRRASAQDHGRTLARGNDPLHLAGCMLYWAEGTKRRNDVEFTNSDPDMAWTFVEFLRRCYGVSSSDIRFTLNVHLNNGLELHEIENWWLAALNLPRRSLGTHTVNRHSSASRRTRRTLPFGTARVVLHSTFVVQSIYGAIQEYARTERPEWLDL